MLRPIRLCRVAYDWLRWRRTTLDPLLEFAATGSEGDDPPEISLVDGPVQDGQRLAGVTFPPGVEAVCRLYAPPGAMVTVDCGIEGPPASVVRFEVTTPRATRHVVVTGGSRWVSLNVPVTPRNGGAPARITLRAELVPGASAVGRPVWGSVVLRWPRSATEIGRTIFRALRQYRLTGFWRRVRAHGSAMASERDQAYRRWLDAQRPGDKDLERMRTESATLAARVRFALLVIVDQSPAAEPTLESIARQAYPYWDTWVWHRGANGSSDLAAILRDSRFHVLGPEITSETDARNALTSVTAADFVTAVDAGDELAPEALFDFATAAARYPDAGVLYSDEDRMLEDGPGEPRFKPDWSPELLFARMYLGTLLAVRRALIPPAGGYRPHFEGAHDYDLSLRITSAGARVVHVPRILCHRAASKPGTPSLAQASERLALEAACRETGRDAVVLPGAAPGIWRVRHRLTGAPHVTIVIPTDAQLGTTLSGRQALVTQCIRSVIERTSYRHYDLLVADNGRLPSDAAALLARVPHQCVTYRWTGPFNFSRKINYAVARAHGEFLLLLNDDVEVINPDWLTAMLEYATQGDIGVVGAKLFYPDGRLQHVGVATGVCGIAAHLLHQHDGSSTGCGYAALAVRNCSAVTGACLLTRRAVYDEVGGFNERMAVDFNDVDFCLRVRAAGYRIVFTPYARLYHHESGSFGSRVQHPDDTQAMREIWGTALDADPYYNPNLSRDFPDCRVAAR